MIIGSVSLQDIEGFDHQLDEVLEAVDTNLKKIATVVRDGAKENLKGRKVTGNLEASVRLRKSKYPDGGYIVIAGGGGKKKGYHAFNVEYGHVLIAWGKVTGKRVPPHPFMRPAVDVGAEYAADLFRSDK